MLMKSVRIVALIIVIPLLVVKACNLGISMRKPRPSLADYPPDHVFTVKVGGQTLAFSRANNPGINPPHRELPRSDGIIYAQDVRLNIPKKGIETEQVRVDAPSLFGGCNMARPLYSPSEQAALEAAVMTDNYIILSQSGPREHVTRRVYFPDTSFLGEPVVLSQMMIVNVFGNYVWQTDFDRTVANCARLHIGLGIDDGHTKDVPVIFTKMEAPLEDILTSAKAD